MLKARKIDLTISIVLYHTDVKELSSVLELLKASTLCIKIFLVDNSSDDDLQKVALDYGVDYIYNNANLGYGKGHNIAIRLAESLSKYHLVMNSDVNFDPAILEKAMMCMERNPDIGLLSPKIRLENGEMQQFCRLLPTPFDLFARRFIPRILKPVFRSKLNQYVLNFKDYSKNMNVPNLPGCFMFMRHDSLKKVNGFDENIFLYVEDIDLTRRLHQIVKTVYYPEIEVVHGLARGSYKFSRLVLYHIKSAIYYFNKWGWFYDKNRVDVNKNILSNNNYVNVNEHVIIDITHFKNAI